MPLNRREFIAAAGAFAGTGLVPSEPAHAARPRNRMSGHRFVFNCDCNDVDYAAPAGKAQEWIRAWYRRAFATAADVFVADVALPDVVDAKDIPSGELIGARFPEEKRKAIPWYRTVSELIAQGTDVLHLACEEARKKPGILVLGGARMSDAHHGGVWKAESDSALFPKIVMEHPEWCNTWEDGSRDATLNYAIPQVRAHRLAILREMATNYDVDGLELDWMRWCRNFPHGKQRQYANVLTGFVADVRGMLDEVSRAKRRERMVLGHRVACTVDECLNMGCDVTTWARDGYADFLAPMDFLLIDLGLRTDEFVKAAKGTGCRVYPGFGARKYSFGRMYDDNNLYEGKDNHRAIMMRSLSQARAIARNFFAWGADGGSSFNMYLWQPEQERFFTEVIAILSDPRKAVAGPRHYIYLPLWKDHGGGVGPTGRFNCQSLTFAPETAGKRQAYAFRMADGNRGEKLRGVLRFRIYNAGPGDEFAVDLNGVAIPASHLLIEHQPNGEVFAEPEGPEALPRGEEPPAFKNSVPFTWPSNLRFEAALQDCPRFRGDNELGITLMKRNASGGKAPVMEALEVLVS